MPATLSAMVRQEKLYVHENGTVGLYFFREWARPANILKFVLLAFLAYQFVVNNQLEMGHFAHT